MIPLGKKISQFEKYAVSKHSMYTPKTSPAYKFILYFFVFFLFLQENYLFCQKESKVDASNHSEICISVGWHTTLFLDKHSIDDFGRKDLSQDGVLEYLALTYFRGTFNSKRNFCYSLDYRTFAKSVHPQNLIKGDVLERSYTAVNFGFGKTIYRSRTISLTPTLYFSAKLNGGEYVLLNHDLYIASRGGATSFGYRSLGIGTGFSYRHILYRNINVGLDLFYTHYFQKSEGYPIPPGFEEYVKNYKVNKDALSLSFTFGYVFDLHNFSKND